MVMVGKESIQFRWVCEHNKEDDELAGMGPCTKGCHRSMGTPIVPAPDFKESMALLSSALQVEPVDLKLVRFLFRHMEEKARI